MLRVRQALAERIGPALVRSIARSWRVVEVGADVWSGGAVMNRPYVLLCWHEVLLPVMWHHRHRGIRAIVSQARDGQYLAAFALSLGYGVIRGSSTRGGRRALLEAIQALRQGVPVGITPDGPRGPRRILKRGALAAAARSGAVVIPVHAEARPGWRARSWDRFLVPPPLAIVRVAYGVPFEVNRDPAGEAAAVLRATQALDDAAKLAAWPDAAATLTA